MNRERLKILRDHLEKLPDERVDMSSFVDVRDEDDLDSQPVATVLNHCGTTACVAGWTAALFLPETPEDEVDGTKAGAALSLSLTQSNHLFYPEGWLDDEHTRTDAIAAIDSMLANPDDGALPVWPVKAVSA